MEQENGNIAGSELAAVEAPRKLVGLVAGRLVNYVMRAGNIRPLLIVEAGDATGVVNGVLFFDGSNDNDNHPLPLLADRYGHVAECARWITSAHYDDLGIEPGTWHWPARPAVVASGIDPAALSVQVEAIMQPILDNINERLATHLAAAAELTENPTQRINAMGSGSAEVGLAQGSWTPQASRQPAGDTALVDEFAKCKAEPTIDDPLGVREQVEANRRANELHDAVVGAAAGDPAATEKLAKQFGEPEKAPSDGESADSAQGGS